MNVSPSSTRSRRCHPRPDHLWFDWLTMISRQPVVTWRRFSLPRKSVGDQLEVHESADHATPGSWLMPDTLSPLLICNFLWCEALKVRREAQRQGELLQSQIRAALSASYEAVESETTQYQLYKGLIDRAASVERSARVAQAITELINYLQSPEFTNLSPHQKGEDLIRLTQKHESLSSGNAAEDKDVIALHSRCVEFLNQYSSFL
jgi:hypothetical protein